jgi:hypothetical protein
MYSAALAWMKSADSRRQQQKSPLRFRVEQRMLPVAQKGLSMFNPTIDRIGNIRRIIFLYLIALLFLPVLAHGQTCSYRAMPLGDSITKGIGSSDLSGYRKELFNWLMINTVHEVDMVGSLKDGPSTFDNDHEGHGGYTASEIALYTLSWLKANPADIVLLHAGTNELTTSIEGVEAILDEIDLFSRDTWVVLALIINRDPYSTTTVTFNNNLLAMAQSRIADGDKIIVVDQEGALLYPHDLADPLHPNSVGYSKMALVWAGALDVLFDNLCSGVPQIITSSVAPKTKAFVNQTYQYQLRAYGDPSFYFELLNSPFGMSIDPDSGAITWTPSAAGSFNVTVRVRNDFGSDSQSFTIVVTDPADELVIDNGGEGTLTVGTWNVSGALNAYGVDSLYSKTVAGTYTFEAERIGEQAVYLWWTQFANRSTNVPVRIYDDLKLLATVYVDQTKNGGRWNLLGSYNFSGMARVVLASTSSSLTTCADAVRFVPAATSIPRITSTPVTLGEVGAPYQYNVDAVGDPTMVFQLTDAPFGMVINAATGLIDWTPAEPGSVSVTVSVSNSSGSDSQSFMIAVTDPADELVLDNGELGTSFVGTWKVSGAENAYGADSIYSKSVSSTYTFQASVSGQQQVSLWWTQYANRNTAVPVRIYDGSALIATVNVDQTINGGRWNLLGTYRFSGVARVVVVSTSSSLTTCADAVRFVPVVTTELVLDNGEPGTSFVGTWKVSGAENAYGADSIYSKSVSSTYTFQASVSGQQQVSLWWTQYANRNTVVPVRIYDGSALIATVNVDQTINGGRWNLLGTYSFSGAARVVVVSTSSSLTTCADAARFIPFN